MYILSIGFCKFAMTINIDITAINNETVKNTSKAKEIHIKIFIHKIIKFIFNVFNIFNHNNLLPSAFSADF